MPEDNVHNIRPLFMNSYAKNVLVLIKVKLMECWADSAWLCIFHFWKCVTQGIKAPFENKAADPFHLSWVSPCHSFSLSLLLSLSAFSGWFPGAQRLSEFTFLPGLLRPNREGTLRLHSREKVLCIFTPSRGRLWPPWTEQVPCQGLYWLSV